MSHDWRPLPQLRFVERLVSLDGVPTPRLILQQGWAQFSAGDMVPDTFEWRDVPVEAE